MTIQDSISETPGALKAVRARILYCFKGGRRNRLEIGGEYPQEFFFGYSQLKAEGLRVDFIEEEDYGRPPFMGRFGRVFQNIVLAATGLRPSSIGFFLRKDVRSTIRHYDIVVATTNSHGISLSFLRTIGVLKAKVIVTAMGILPLDAPKRHRRLFRWITRETALAPISKPEAESLLEEMGRERSIRYLPFGVDHRFWSPGSDNRATEEYALTIGNDSFRDYSTLAEAWLPHYPPLKVVTQLSFPDSQGRVEVIAGDWKRRLLSDEDIRELMRRARFVIIPLRQTIQPSGQSATLQAMSCGKTVILSNILGMWDPDAMVDHETCLLARPGSVADIRAAVEHLLENPRLAGEIGSRARETVIRRMNLEIMAKAMRGRVEEMTQG